LSKRRRRDVNCRLRVVSWNEAADESVSLPSVGAAVLVEDVYREGLEDAAR